MNKEEQKSILSDLIRMAYSDNQFSVDEKRFLEKIADQIGLSLEEFNTLSQQPAESYQPKTHAERILQFHRLILVMNIDQHRTHQEKEMLLKFALRMGVSSDTVEAIWREMEKYENHVIPPKVLISMFNVHLN